MLSWIPIRWRITLFHILTMLGIAALLSIGMFAVFGIAAAHQARIFERFYRAEQSRTTRGAGLGLAIAHDIVTRHGGTIAVTSAPGEGATFTVRLPLASDGGTTLPGSQLS